MKIFFRTLVFFVACLLVSQTASAQAFNWAVSAHVASTSPWGMATVAASAIDAAGNIYIGANSYSDTQIGTQNYPASDTSTANIIKLGPNGNVIWVKRYQNPNSNVTITDLKADPAGNVYVTGHFSDSLTFGNITLMGYMDYFLGKWDTADNPLWVVQGGGNGFCIPRSIALDAAGNILMGGYYMGQALFGPYVLTPTNPSLIIDNAFLAKFSPSGAVLSATSAINTTNTQTLISNVGSDMAGNTYIEGRTTGNFTWGNLAVTADPQYNTTFWIKLNASGLPVDHFTRQQTINIANAMVVDEAGYTYLANQFNGTLDLGGITFTSGLGTSTYLAKYDPNGVLQWAKHLRQANTIQSYVRSYDLTLDAQGRVYLSGSYYGANMMVGSITLAGSGAPGTTMETAFAAAFEQYTGSVIWAEQAVGGGVTGKTIAANATGQLAWAGDFFGSGVTLGSVVTGTAAPGNTPAFYITRILQNFNTIAGTVFVDQNSNSIQDATETGHPDGIMVEVNPGNYGFHTALSGAYEAVVGSGTFSPSVTNAPLYHTVVPLGPASATFTDFGSTQNGFNFALQPIPNQQDLRVHITPLQPARPGFTTTYRITYKNVGTTAMSSGNVTLNFDPLLSYLSSTPSGTLAGTTLTWAFSNLLPGQTRNINATFSLPTSATVGAIINCTAQVGPISGDLTPADNSETNSRPITASYDPNNITVNYPQLDIQQVQDGKWLEYTIRFQNMGTDTAFTVMLRDSLPSGQLQLATIQMQSASHNCSWSVNSSGVMTVLFTNIKLPHLGVNVVGSNGFIRFRVRPQPSLSPGDIIPNRAHIYFDYNPQITTNTATTQVLVTGVSDGLSAHTVKVWPNPSPGTFNLSAELLSAGNVQILLSTMLGQQVFQTEVAADAGTLRQQVDVNHLPAGMYLLQLHTPDGVVTRQIIKQ